MILSATGLAAQNGKATTIKKKFSRSTEVSIDIDAEPELIWKLLTSASDMASWNSTIISLGGSIVVGNKLLLVSTLDSARVFKLKVKGLDNQNFVMIWGDSKGNRTFRLTKNPNGTVKFNMYEKIGGLMFPMYSKFIPPFDEAFEQFAADLKKAAEAK